MSSVFCISCGTESQHIANYCFQCGFKLQKTTIPNPPPFPTNKKAIQNITSSTGPQLLKSKSTNAIVQLATVQHCDDFKDTDSHISSAFRAAVTSAVITINQTLKPIDLPSVQRLFDDEKELNESTITDIDPDVFCARAKQYNITTSQAKRILNELQSMDAYKPTAKKPKPKEKKEIDKLRSGLLAAESMKALTDCTNDKERELLMKDKLELCEVVCDWNNTVDGREINRIENKKDLLLEVLRCMSGNNWSNIELLKQCIKTISHNLFRSLPSAEMIKTGPNDDEMDFRDPSWDHLQLIYELTFHVVTNTHIDKKTMQKHLQGAFLENLIHLFSSVDCREPQYVKIIVHAIYGRFMVLRRAIRKHLSNYCYQYVYLSTSQSWQGVVPPCGYVTSWQGLPEILEIFCSIFQGLNVPIKPDYHTIFRNVIIPLHKSFHLDEFHEQLLQCCTQFVTKDPYSAPVVLGAILKFWPRQNPLKEQLFITEISHILNVCVRHPNVKQSDPAFASITIAVLNKFVECMTSTHHIVAERSLMVWRDETVKILVDLHRERIWPKIYKALQQNNEHYWLSAIRNINRQIASDFKRRDPDFWGKIEQQRQDGNNNEEAEDQKEETPLSVPQQPDANKNKDTEDQNEKDDAKIEVVHARGIAHARQVDGIDDDLRTFLGPQSGSNSKLDLLQHFSVLFNAGYTNNKALCRLSDDRLAELGIEKVFHRRALMKRVRAKWDKIEKQRQDGINTEEAEDQNETAPLSVPQQSDATMNKEAEEQKEESALDEAKDQSCFGKSGNVEVGKCRFVLRLISDLKQYDSFANDPSAVNDFCGKKDQNILNDYNHLIGVHGNQLDEIGAQLITHHQFEKCDVSKCSFTTRHYDNSCRDKHTLSNDELNTDSKSSFFQQIFDSIHYYIFHLFDVGLRIKQNDSDNTEPDDAKEDDAGKCVDAQLRQIADVQLQKREFERFKSTKFKINNAAGTNEGSDEQKGGNDNKKAASSGSFNIGLIFYYWPYYQSMKYLPNQTTSNANDHGGYEIHELFVEQKHVSFKDEILNCGHISLTEYDDVIMVKAEQYIHTDIAKSLQSAVPLYDIIQGTPLSKDNLIALILYCDFSKLCTDFSSTFRPTYASESLESIKKHNQKYWFLSKILRETVELYGYTANKLRGPWYCGMTYMIVANFACRLCSPTSASQQFAVAVKFSGDKGIIMQLNNTNSPRLRGFDCSWISSFHEEDERLFMGGSHPIRIESVKDVRTKMNFKPFFNALFYFDSMLSGARMKGKVSKMDLIALKALIKHELAPTEDNCKLPEYILKAFHLFCENKTQIVINLPSLDSFGSKKLNDLILHSVVKFDPKSVNDIGQAAMNDTSSQNLLNETVFTLFKNAKELIINSSDSFDVYPFSVTSLLSVIDSNTNHVLHKMIIYAKSSSHDLGAYGGKSWLHDLWSAKRVELIASKTWSPSYDPRDPCIAFELIKSMSKERRRMSERIRMIYTCR